MTGAKQHAFDVEHPLWLGSDSKHDTTRSTAIASPLAQKTQLSAARSRKDYMADASQHPKNRRSSHAWSHPGASSHWSSSNAKSAPSSIASKKNAATSRILNRADARGVAASRPLKKSREAQSCGLGVPLASRTAGESTDSSRIRDVDGASKTLL
jgi:hypothetical protein